MSFRAKIYVSVDIDDLKMEDKKKIMEEVSEFLGEYPIDADNIEYEDSLRWDLEDDGLNEEIYFSCEEIEKLKELLKEINEKYDVNVKMKIWNLEEPDFVLDTNPNIIYHDRC